MASRAAVAVRRAPVVSMTTAPSRVLTEMALPRWKPRASRTPGTTSSTVGWGLMRRSARAELSLTDGTLRGGPSGCVVLHIRPDSDVDRVLAFDLASQHPHGEVHIVKSEAVGVHAMKRIAPG